MALCKEKLVNYLDGLGYNVVHLPRTDINPLDLIIKDGKQFDNLGSVKEIWTSSEDVPVPQTDGKAAGIRQKETSLLDVSVGVSALGDIFSGMGFSVPQLNAALSKAKKLKIVFNNVKLETIAPFAIGKYLRKGDINKLDEGNVMVRHFLDDELSIYIISQTLKSNSITIEAYSDVKTSAAIDIGVLKDAIKANPSIKTEKERESSITYTGGDSDYLVFGFKCYEINYSPAGWGVNGIGKDVYLDEESEAPLPVKLNVSGRLSLK